jgi:diguanylate cyclase (GGDEF)-like protein
MEFMPERLRSIIETQDEIAGSTLELDDVMSLVANRAQQLVGAAAGAVELIEGEELVHRAASGAAEPHVGLRLAADSSLSGLCVERDEVLYCEDARSDPRVDATACEEVGAISLVCVPLRFGGKVVGVFKVYAPQERAFNEADIQILSLLAGMIAARMSHASDYREQAPAGHHDALTDLATRRSFEERLAAEAARVRRHGGQVSLCLVDLDGVQQVNDRSGQAAGDLALRSVARHLSEVRTEDAAYRIGAHQFALILVEAGEHGALLAAERIAAAVQDDPACEEIAFSFGVAALGDGDPQGVVARADAAMSGAKRSLGR